MIFDNICNKLILKFVFILHKMLTHPCCALLKKIVNFYLLIENLKYDSKEHGILDGPLEGLTDYLDEVFGKKL